VPLDTNSQTSISFVNNLIATTVTMVVKPPHGASAIHKLEWLGQHTATVEVPFSFTDIQLP
jgi:hypothetical protein